jgi:SWI/SNF-related matrix-associated actin-dependent regulator of chromatin subfamily A3
VGSIALRRMKNQLKNGKPIVDLPKRDIFIEHIVLSEEERQLYNTMQHEGKLVVNRFVSLIQVSTMPKKSFL